MLGLCRTLDYQVLRVFKQNLKAPNPKYYLGRGKVAEISNSITSDAGEVLDFAAFDCALKPNQSFNLENTLHVRVLDRNALIMIIFLHHARTKEAKLQVEYAILKHQLPYVTELIRRTKLGEHPGLMAGGEYKVDEYYRLTKTRIKKIRQQLSKIKTSREQRRKYRRRRGFSLITLAGYTNAGKSALLKALTNVQIPVDDRMFSTVSPKTRRVAGSRLLLTDTVGFIKNIPTQLIEAFKSTLEEIIDTDHILLVVDISEEVAMVKEKLKTCLKTINQLITETYSISSDTSNGDSFFIPKRPWIHLAFNKIDLEPEAKKKSELILSSLEINQSAQGISSNHLISCKTKEGVKVMVERIKSY